MACGLLMLNHNRYWKCSIHYIPGYIYNKYFGVWTCPEKPPDIIHEERGMIYRVSFATDGSVREYLRITAHDAAMYEEGMIDNES